MRMHSNCVDLSVSLANVFTYWVWFCDRIALCCLCLELMVSSDPLASVGAQVCLCLDLFRRQEE